MTGETADDMSSLDVAHIFSVAGKSVVVTGGASGLGLAIARGYAANGAIVTIVDRDQSAIDNAIGALGKQAQGLVADITDRAALDAAFDRIDGDRGGIDVIFANAGIGGGPGFARPDGNPNPQGAIDDPSTGDWDAVVAVNLMGVRNTLGAAARIMKRRGRGGRIIVTSSAAALVNVVFVSTAYHATKAAVAHLSRQVALELAPYGILVNAIAPANFVTNIGDGGMSDDAVKALFASTSALGRTAMPDEIVGLALFYGSSASSYVTGTHMLIDGGSALCKVP
ncbi:NAD(P)-dependent dehydrogenase (short-subunit alcohol dehydrogenase family) [Novosphingobium chloroacetimidivorans]|uniref:NAD(P)-dependent dehydrogenase (Short-subunit alcohol dehydrogenase family) n=1 Tax=Novosphingobium chloroacetimidivorans TaxID=1428314 RepID=A0A7W7KD95_9SPHN|nr:SDR family NAD(P)-dependent oxidoreductase [Novosphingobium chloroacetimidivorans]MBB4860281.1 NAD(P)-dependent dehydrogenase (short-subunit alcohol dehydrogenase family) [Novosphingobium chloroacetimidivorans]